MRLKKLLKDRDEKRFRAAEGCFQQPRRGLYINSYRHRTKRDRSASCSLSFGGRGRPVRIRVKGSRESGPQGRAGKVRPVFRYPIQPFKGNKNFVVPRAPRCSLELKCFSVHVDFHLSRIPLRRLQQEPHSIRHYTYFLSIIATRSFRYQDPTDTHYHN